jgi:uncharacterized protein (TIGR02453 family)
MPDTNQFNGFRKETIKYLVELGLNNYKTWFEEHRMQYEKYLLEPMKSLVTDMSKSMCAIDPEFEVQPKVDKTISRIYRDIRFSKDKTPYRNNMWITFKRTVDDWKDYPVFFFELMTDSYRYGLGYYQASTETMKVFRRNVDADPEGFLAIIKPISRYFEVKGDNYKRPVSFIHDTRINDYYNKKSFYLSCDKALDDIVFSKKLVSEIKTGFKKLDPLYKYLILCK